MTIVVHDMERLQEALADIAVTGKRIALVPTMGALHAGHMSLIEVARSYADAVVLYIFVNPKQFGPNEDFAKYPRTLDDDVQMASAAEVDIVYAPTPEDVYHPGFSTNVSAGEMATLLCGKSRPGHFDGVATVLTKMFMRILPHVAVFGEKDYQQLCVIRKFVDDLDIPVEIIGAPTCREADGLAMSSRNRYLSKEERTMAPKLYEILKTVGTTILSESLPISAALEQGRAALAAAGFKLDYLELCDAYSLIPAQTLDYSTRLLVAVWLGNTRLIDNVAVE